jgi:peptidoglycan/xylan/chitin deacetylase (PgdA/CDA1 family)
MTVPFRSFSRISRSEDRRRRPAKIRTIVSRDRPMRSAKQIALRVGFHAGFLRLVQFARRQQAVILMFHRFFADGRGDPRGLPIAKFAEYMKYLAASYRVVSLRDLTRELRRGAMRPNTAVVTVDDGYDDFLSLAAPVLRRHGIPASIFVVSDFVEGRLWPWTDHFRFVFDRAPLHQVTFRHRRSTHILQIRDEDDRLWAEEHWREYAKTVPVAEREDLLEAIAEACGIEVPTTPPPECRSLTWAQLRTLAAEGFDVGAHTRSHPILSHSSPEQSRDEIHGCKQEIERNLGSPVAHFAYPNGKRRDYTSEVVEEVARAGYEAAVTAVAGANTGDTPIFELQRIGGSAEDLAHFAQAVSGLDLLRERLRL